MPTGKRLIFPTIVLLITVVLAACSESGDTIETVEMPTLDGGTVQLEDYTGQVVVVNFWATWCGPCVIEMPELQAFYDEYNSQGVEMLGINLGEDAETAQAFIDERDITYPIILDQNGNIADFYALRGQPTTVVFDQNGTIVYKHTGLLNQETLEEQVDPLL